MKKLLLVGLMMLSSFMTFAQISGKVVDVDSKQPLPGATILVKGTKTGVVTDFDNGMPVVQTYSGKKITVENESWHIEEEGIIKAKISQIPLRLAWAITIHKSQGSEYRHAIVVLPTGRSRLLTRELLYTGVSRAREQLTIVATEAALRTAVTTVISRASGLADRL